MNAVKRLTFINGFLLLVLGVFTGIQVGRPATASAADPYRGFEPQLNSPAVGVIPIAKSDSAELSVPSRGIYVGGAGDVVLIGMNDGSPLNGASTANAATLTINTVGAGNLPAYSSGTPGQYIIVNDGTHAAEIISGYLNTAGTTLTVTIGGGSGSNTMANAHNSGTLVAAYAPMTSLNAGTVIPVRAKRVMSTNTTATNLVELY